MNFVRQRFSSAVCVGSLVLLAACAQKKVTVGPAATPASTLILTRVGSGTLTAHADDIITLTSLLVKSDGKSTDTPTPVSGSTITWKLLEVPGPVTLSNATTTTDMSGLSQTTLTLGTVASGEVKVQANTTGVTNSQAIWVIQVQPVIEHIRIIPSGQQVVLTNPSTADTAAVNAAIGTQVNLQVQVTEDNGATQTPVSSVPVTFSFVTSITGAAFPLAPAGVVTTSMQGGASMALAVGTVLGAYELVATIPGGIHATFNVTVSAHPPICTLSSDCGGNEVCVGGECQAGGTNGASCGNSDNMCPIGYTCSSTSEKCVPLTVSTCTQSMCPNGFSCDSSTNTCEPIDPQCGPNTQCPSGATCRSGICYPDDGSTIDVTGFWYTEHDFNVQAALPSWLQTTGEVVRVLDEILLGQIPGLPSIVDALIRGIVQQYVPSWVSTVVYLIDNLFTIFTDLRAKGEMDLTAIGGPAVLYGTEQWDSFVFYLLSQCGQMIGTPNPADPPACAEVDVYTADLAQVNLNTTVDPFTATLSGNQLLFDRRTVELQLAGIIEYVINQVISTTTGYASLQGPPGDPQDGALYNLIDCAGLAQLIESAGIPIDITSICQAFVAAAADAIAQQLSMITVSTNVLSFTGQATALCTSALDTPCPTTGSPTALGLGYPDFETNMPADGMWNAEFVGLVNNVPGRWRAARQPW
jgi:hypothetical protein